MKSARILFTVVILIVLIGMASCGSPLVVEPTQTATIESDKPQNKTYKDLIVGYVQLGDDLLPA